MPVIVLMCEEIIARMSCDQHHSLQTVIEDYATTRQLRSSYKHLLAVPYVKTDTVACAFRVSAPTIWNSLPTLVKSSSTLVTFKRHLKTFLYRRAFDLTTDTPRL